jgi:hypothetical protein
VSPPEQSVKQKTHRGSSAKIACDGEIELGGYEEIDKQKQVIEREPCETEATPKEEGSTGATM